ncbi:Selenoprotein Pb [Labeo rohita]|uniref:Selenoprotein Pb n=1 Tax=Labeo rohita TaxID=84645 RepID=A0ABQ8MXN9_LABRO|nr:Selenoprotein Pb [Labeo rohita]
MLRWVKFSRHDDAGSLGSVVVCSSSSAGGFATLFGEGKQWLQNLLGDLRDKLARGKLTNISFMVVNEQDAQSRAMYWELKRRTAEGIPVYQQNPLQKDVWDILEGDKDDFLVYDRCGYLTFHIVLPFSFLHYPYIEAAIRATYHKNICNCSLNPNTSISEGFENNKNKVDEHTENNQKTNNTEPVTVEHHHHHQHEHHHHQHVHYHHHEHVHHHHHHHNQNNNNSTDDSDVSSVPNEPIQHSHQKHRGIQLVLIALNEVCTLNLSQGFAYRC